MAFNEQINLLLSLSKLHSTELDSIEYAKERSESILRDIEECYENMKNMLPTLQYIRSLLISLLKVNNLIFFIIHTYSNFIVETDRYQIAIYFTKPGKKKL